MEGPHEGEILLAETYSSSQWKRYYVKPPDQNTVAVVDEGKNSSLSAWLKYVFLPQGYPESVSKDYTNYQIWDTAQAFCSTIMGILATQEVLRGVGVGDEASTPLAATVTWVFKDGCGHISRIIFAYARGTHLDAYSKKWRLYADLLNDMAMCIEISLPAFKSFTTPALCISSAMKAIVGVAGGASRIAMTQHQALRNNLADLSAKDSAQETAVNLVASICAIGMVSVLGWKSMTFLFILLMILHITFNYLAVRSVCLRSLNEPRFLRVIKAYLLTEEIPTPCIANRHEPVIFYQRGTSFLDYKLCGFSITLGRSLRELIKNRSDSEYLKQIIELHKLKSYILYPLVAKRRMYVLLREGATVEDCIVSYFHAALLSAVICSVNSDPLRIFELNDRPFAEICATLEASDWTREARNDAVKPGELRFNPSLNLMLFVDEMVSHEKRRFFEGLTEIGWDLSKHLLLHDEWRISAHEVDPMVQNQDNMPPDDAGPRAFVENIFNAIAREMNGNPIIEGENHEIPIELENHGNPIAPENNVNPELENHGNVIERERRGNTVERESRGNLAERENHDAPVERQNRRNPNDRESFDDPIGRALLEDPVARENRRNLERDNNRDNYWDQEADNVVQEFEQVSYKLETEGNDDNELFAGPDTVAEFDLAFGTQEQSAAQNKPQRSHSAP